jgi:uncharacterized protein UPF0236
MNLTQQIISTVADWQKQLLSSSNNSDSMAAMEQSALLLARRVARLALTNLLEQCGTGYDHSMRPCSCGANQRFLRYAQRTLRTLMGQLTYRRAYYRCSSCGESSFPIDEQIRQSAREISPGVERAIALLSAHLPFAEVERVLEQVTAVKVSARQIETVAEEVGLKAELIQQEEAQLSAGAWLSESSGPNQPQPKTYIVEMDGVQVGLQDGSWQEVKCGVVYELTQRVEISTGRWELFKRQRCVVRGDVLAFRARLWALCLRVGIREKDRVIVIGDGAQWIDQTAQIMFPKATRILDYYHATERIWLVANVRFGEGSTGAKQWAEARMSQLKSGQVGAVIGSIKRLKMKAGEGQTVRASTISYLRNRVEQMKYGEYRKEGLPIGSGAVESSCKQLVTARCKQAGMRWSEAGVDAILALRSFVVNERLDEVCQKPEISIEWAEAA